MEILLRLIAVSGLLGQHVRRIDQLSSQCALRLGLSGRDTPELTTSNNLLAFAWNALIAIPRGNQI